MMQVAFKDVVLNNSMGFRIEGANFFAFRDYALDLSAKSAKEFEALSAICQQPGFQLDNYGIQVADNLNHLLIKIMLAAKLKKLVAAKPDGFDYNDFREFAGRIQFEQRHYDVLVAPIMHLDGFDDLEQALVNAWPRILKTHYSEVTERVAYHLAVEAGLKQDFMFALFLDSFIEYRDKWMELDMEATAVVDVNGQEYKFDHNALKNLIGEEYHGEIFEPLERRARIYLTELKFLDKKRSKVEVEGLDAEIKAEFAHANAQVSKLCMYYLQANISGNKELMDEAIEEALSSAKFFNIEHHQLEFLADNLMEVKMGFEPSSFIEESKRRFFQKLGHLEEYEFGKAVLNALSNAAVRHDLPLPQEAQSAYR